MKNYIICSASKNLGMYLSKRFETNNKVFKFGRSLNNGNYSYSCDFLNYNSIFQKLKKIKITTKNIDGIIYCIGESKKYYAKRDDLSFWRQSFDSNLYTFINFLNAYVEVFKKKKINTKIIVISSIAGNKIIKAPITYSVAKCALNFYSKIKAKELINLGIQINTISLGNVYQKNNNWGKKLKKNKKKVENYIQKNVSTNKFCNPEEVFNLCNVIFNNDLNLLGSNIVLDGGQSL